MIATAERQQDTRFLEFSGPRAFIPSRFEIELFQLRQEFENFTQHVGATNQAELRNNPPHNWPTNTQIGNTPLLRLYGLENLIKEARLGKFPDCKEDFNAEIWMKVEGLNFTSTHKDRASLAHCLEAIKQGKTEVTIATCGNAGESLAAISYCKVLACTIFLPKSVDIEAQVVTRMKTAGATVIFVDGNYDEAVEASEFYAATHEYVYDANSGSINKAIEFKAYETVALEIYDVLKKAHLSPQIKSISGPVGNGAFFVGVNHGFQERFGRNLIGEMPKFIGGTNSETNPLYEAFRSGKHTIPPKHLCERLSCETLAPLATDMPSCATETLRALRNSGGDLKHVDRKSLEKMAQRLFKAEGDYLRDQKIRPIFAGLAGLQALYDELTENKNPKIGLNGIHVSIITGIHD